MCSKNHNILIVADENTFLAAGEATVSALTGKYIKKVIFSGTEILVPNEVAIAKVTDNLENIDLITNNAVYDKNENEYLLADDLKVYIRTATGYDYSSISDIMKGDYVLTAYYDKLPLYGGRIRVITAFRRV